MGFLSVIVAVALSPLGPSQVSRFYGVDNLIETFLLLPAFLGAALLGRWLGVLTAGVAIVTVRFEADIAAVTRNAEGQVVAGSLSDAVQTRDLWTFRRDLASRDPNWFLIETDEEA